jgi:hypothetical protein
MIKIQSKLFRTFKTVLIRFNFLGKCNELGKTIFHFNSRYIFSIQLVPEEDPVEG